jgi:hypothetical protein
VSAGRSARFSRAEDRHQRNAKAVGEMHCAGVVREEDPQLYELLDEPPSEVLPVRFFAFP